MEWKWPERGWPLLPLTLPQLAMMTAIVVVIPTVAKPHNNYNEETCSRSLQFCEGMFGEVLMGAEEKERKKKIKRGAEESHATLE